VTDWSRLIAEAWDLWPREGASTWCGMNLRDDMRSKTELIVSTDPRRLLDEAASGFFDMSAHARRGPFPTPPYLLVVRQGGLRDDLITRAAELGVPGWFDPPLCTFAELPERLGLPEGRPIGDFERVVLLDTIARSVAPVVFGAVTRIGTFLDSLDRLVGDLIREGVTSEQLAQGLRAVDEWDGFKITRDHELVRIYRGYQAALTEHRLRDPRAALMDCARNVTDDPNALAEALGDRGEIRVLGIHDLRGGWRQLLSAIDGSPVIQRVVLYGADSALGELIGVEADLLDGVTTAARPLIRPPSLDTVGVISAPDPERELQEVAVRVRRLLDSGVKPQRIAIVSRHARPMTDLAIESMNRIGVLCAARRRIGFAEIPAVRSLSALFAAAAEGWTRHALVELADQPYLDTGLDRRIVNFIGFSKPVTGLDDWTTALHDLERRAREQEERDTTEDERRQWLPYASRVQRARERFERFRDSARPLDESRTLAHWLVWLDESMAADRWGIEDAIPKIPSEQYDIVRRDMAGYNALRVALHEWRDAVDRWGADDTPLSAKIFHDRLREMLSADAALWTPAHRGIRVLEGLAAAYRSFDHVFLVGLETGRFPARRRISPILDEDERESMVALGLPLESGSTWDRRERILFQLMLGAGRHVTLSHARLDDRGREVAPSVFLEGVKDMLEPSCDTIPTGRILTPLYPVYASAVAGKQAVRGASIEHARATGQLGPYNGQIVDAHLLARVAKCLGADHVWSPTQLEGYAKCPWAWFSQRLLRLEVLDDPEPDMDAATRGTVLHAALKVFYDRLRLDNQGPVFIRESEVAGLAPRIAEALDHALDDSAGSAWMGHRALRNAKRGELFAMLTAYVAWEAAENEKSFSARTNPGKTVRTAVDEHEVAFDGLTFERDGIRIALRGHIDRVEVENDDDVPAEGWVAAVDYKSSIYSTPGGGKSAAWEDGVVLQVPLYAWALSQLRPGSRTARVEYRALRQAAYAHQLRLARVDRKQRAVREDSQQQAVMDHALDAVADHVRRARAGEFPARYAPSCKCPPWCHGWDICRVKGGPQPLMNW